VNITTPLDEQRQLRKVEQRIEEHRRELAADSKPGVADGKQGDAEALLPTAPGSLRLVDPDAAPLGKAEGKEVVVRSRTTTGQVLWPATQEDIDILSDSDLMYPAPMEVEGSVIIRLVRLSDPVTSPVGRTVRNRQFGIRGNERWQLLTWGLVCTVGVYSLGVWQLYRMEWKRELLEMRRTRLAAPRVIVNTSPFPWTGNVDDFLYRVVQVRGVFDHQREMRVGPRPGLDDDSGETQSGYNIVTPLRLEDGSTILVNRGHVGMEKLDPSDRPEVPAWVVVRGVLEQGEVANFVGSHARLKNRPDRNLFIYLVADELAENAGARNHQECAQALVTAFDCLYEDDFKAGVRRSLPFSMRHKEDYLLFWADEHTHFNYAMQWFGLGSLIMVMTAYKFIEVSRWRF
jgi:cytochrome oxidase assembly protein ShyY1